MSTVKVGDTVRVVKLAPMNFGDYDVGHRGVVRGVDSVGDIYVNWITPRPAGSQYPNSGRCEMLHPYEFVVDNTQPDDIDPMDLAMLSAGWQRAQRQFKEMGEDAAQLMIDTAKMLQRLWREVSERWGDGVWMYAVAAPLGYEMGHDRLTLEEAEARARELVEEALAEEETA